MQRMFGRPSLHRRVLGFQATVGGRGFDRDETASDVTLEVW